jgi:hypothetical protein
VRSHRISLLRQSTFLRDNLARSQQDHGCRPWLLESALAIYICKEIPRLALSSSKKLHKSRQPAPSRRARKLAMKRISTSLHNRPQKLNLTKNREIQEQSKKKSLARCRVPTSFVVEDQLSVAKRSLVELRAHNARINVMRFGSYLAMIQFQLLNTIWPGQVTLAPVVFVEQNLLIQICKGVWEKSHDWTAESRATPFWVGDHNRASSLASTWGTEATQLLTAHQIYLGWWLARWRTEYSTKLRCNE